MQTLTEQMPRKRVHFIGIGGIGMSALAQLVLAHGFMVSGSDVKANKQTTRLEALGACVYYTHAADNVGDVDAVVYSSSITADNPERMCAQRRNIPLLHRSQLLALLMEPATKIAISGAHGKTTTSALTAFLFKQSGLNPSFAVGADVAVLGGNAQRGCGAHFIAEADESDGSFLNLTPDYAIITNIDREHLDYYTDLAHIIETYRAFVQRVSPHGAVICCGHDANIRAAVEGAPARVITYGLSPDYDVQASAVRCQNNHTVFDCRVWGESLGTMQLGVCGEHNVLNALAAITVAKLNGIENERIRQTVRLFSGADRRFQVRTLPGGVTVVDDYAHHPTEIMATLKAAKLWNARRVIGVFQPHRFSRTKFLQTEFGQCFFDCDYLILTDIYAASESPIQGVAAETIAEQVKQQGHRQVVMLRRAEVNAHICQIARAGDMVVFLGAGDIGSLAAQFDSVYDQRPDRVSV